MLDKSLSFLKLLRDFEKVERAVYRPENRKENDAEHSFQVALMCWFLVDAFELDLDKEKILKYGLVHDLVETYAGDTCVFPNAKVDSPSIESKEEREHVALKRIKEEFKDLEDIISSLEDYENKVDDESIFVYEVDKLIPLLNIYLDKGYCWKKINISLEDIITEKRKKVKTTKELVDLLEEVLERLDQEKEELFGV